MDKQKNLKDKANAKRERRKKPIVSTPSFTDVNITPDLSKPEELADLKHRPLQKIEAVTPFVQTDGKPQSVVSKESPVSPIVGKAETIETGAPKSIVKPATFSDMLAPLRASAVQEKTDAQKMQKYYAMSDVLNALGKMGGTVVGGSIGGNALDSAPVAEPYKESRGYLEAFERSRQADERLRKLDEQEFNFALNKKQRDEEMAFKAQQEQAAREFKARESALERDWDIRLFNYKTEIEQAIADKNFDKKAQLEQAMAKEKQAFELALENLRNQGDIAVANIRNSNFGKATPIRFKNGAVANIPDNYYKSLRRDIIGEVINGVEVDEDNIDEVISNNPNYVRDYLSGFGLNDIVLSQNPKYSVGITRDINGDVDFPLHISQVPSNQMDKKTQESQSSNKTNAPAKKMDISGYKQKK
jgi:hypothetical protein